MNNYENQIKFTGEFFIPGESSERIEIDHMERYRFACQYVIKKEVLDIACGFGYAGPVLVEAGALKYEGVDINKQLIDNARLKYGTDLIKYNVGDLCSYSTKGLFDIILCFETIEHVKDYKSALINLFSLLKADGLLIISSPNRPVTSPHTHFLTDKPANLYHVQEFTVKELKSELITAGFSIDSNNIFGQRSSFFYSTNKYVNKITKFIFGDQSNKASPKVSRINIKIPRYFIIVAKK